MTTRSRAVVAMYFGLKFFGLALFGLALWLVSPTPAHGQTPGDKIEVLQIVETEAGEITVEIGLPSGFEQGQLTRQDFALAENGVAKDLRVEVPNAAVNVVIVIDVSASMANGQLEAAKAAAIEFVDRFPAEAQLAVVSFGVEATVVSPLGTDRQQTRQALTDLQIAGNETVLWDGLQTASEILAANPSQRPYVVVLADGEDTVSTATQESAVASLSGVDAGLYAIALDSANADHASLSQTVGLVGGNIQTTADINALNALYSEAATRLANRYLLSYPSTAGLERQISISVGTGQALTNTSFVIPGRPPETTTTSPDATSDPTTVEDQPAAEPEQAAPLVAEPLVARTVPGPPLLGTQTGLLIGLVAIFGAIVAASSHLTIPAVSVDLDRAAGTDRMVNLRSQLSDAAQRLLSRQDREGRLETMLDLAGVNLRGGEFVALVMSLVILIALGIGALTNIVTGLLVAVGIGVGSFVYLNLLMSRRRQKFNDQLSEALGVIISSLKAGISLPQALEAVATQTVPPISAEFRRTVFEARLGRDIHEAMLSVAERMDSSDFRWVAQAVHIGRTSGGNLTEILENISDTIRDRRRVAREIRSLSGEGRATAWVLILMPPVLMLILSWRTPDNMRLFIEEPTGRLLLLIAIIGMVAGSLWVRQLVKVKY